MLLRVGIDTGYGANALSPIFDDGSFEYIPIPQRYDDDSEEDKTYGSAKIKNPIREKIGYKVLSELRLPEMLKLKDSKGKTHYKKTKDSKIHFDPEFKSFTYGDPTSKRNFLLKLEEDDLLVFYAGLTPYKNVKYKNAKYKISLYIIGYFTVKKVINFCELTDDEVEKCFQDYSKNAHLKKHYESKREMRKITGEKLGLVIVVGKKEKSALLDKAISISNQRLDEKERPYQVVSNKMNSQLGIEGSIQRSVSPRVIDKESNLNNLKRILGLK